MNQNPIVLMYHGVIGDQSQIPNDREPGANLYDVGLHDFTQQMKAIKESGLCVSASLAAEKNEKKAMLVITFDDGEMNNFTQAYPVLRQFGFSAYFFVTVNRIGKKGYMGWDELKKMVDTDMVIGSHGLNHEILTKLSKADLSRELVESKALLENHLKTKIDSFSVPRGFFNNKILQEIQEAGYSYIYISGYPAALPEGCWGRTPIKGDWSLERFQMALQGQTPLGENLFDAFKTVVKRFLGGVAYGKMRSLFLKKS